MMLNRATIEDVAAKAQVSRAAVSKVLRNAHGVSADMRTRVEAAVAELGYRPRLAARAMRGSTNTIGVVVNHLANQFLSEVLEGAMTHDPASTYQFIVAPSDPLHSDGHDALEALFDREVDGILAVAPIVEAGWMQDFARRVPTVVIGRHDPSETYDTITGDDITGAELAVRHLIELGHTDIAHVTHFDPRAVSEENTPHALRRETYERVMTETGLESQISIIVGRFEEEPAYAAALRHFRNKGVPTAIFAGNDDAAFGVMRAIDDFGLTSTDVALVGYDNSRLAAHPRLSLTSVDQKGIEMGRRAFDLLQQRIGGRSEAVHESIQTELFIRASSVRPHSN